MGYTTDFYGQLSLSPPLNPAQVAYLQAFNRTRRMKRDVNVLLQMPDPKREAVNLPLGTDGEFYVGSEDDYGQKHSPSILNYNGPPLTQPGLWCQWVVSDDGATLEWDGGEKFYSYDDWLHYIIDNFLAPWGVIASGEIEWYGEDRADAGKIVVSNNVIEILIGRMIYAPTYGGDYGL